MCRAVCWWCYLGSVSGSIEKQRLTGLHLVCTQNQIKVKAYLNGAVIYYEGGGSIWWGWGGLGDLYLLETGMLKSFLLENGVLKCSAIVNFIAKGN